MASTGIWLSDQDLSQTAGAIWAQQQMLQVTQRAQAGQDWAAQQMARLQQQAAQQVQALTAPSPTPATPAAPAPTPIPTPTAAPMPQTEPVAAAPTATPTPIPPTPTPDVSTPAPIGTVAAPPTVPTPQVPSSDMAQAGEDWANQQLQKLLNPSGLSPAPTAAPGPAPTPLPIPGLPDQTSLQGALGAPTATPTPTTSGMPSATPQPTPAPSAAGGGAPLGPIDASSPQAFASSIAPYAQSAAQQLGIDPKWVAAMAASESNYGKAPGNELFGIKALPGQASQSLATHEGEYGGTNVNQDFAAYQSPQDAVDAFVNLIKNHYPGAVGAQDLGTFVHGLKQGGYFTAAEPEYAGILQGIQGRIGDAVDAALQGGQNVASSVQNVAQQGQTAVNNGVQAVQSAVARTSQFAMGLSSGDAMAFCGPAAAMAFAQTYGRNPTVDEAKQLAQQVGWNSSQGMAGPSSEVKLLNAMGIDAHATSGVDWGSVAQSASSGNPVIIDTPGHYFYVDGYNSDTGQFHLGSSATDLKAAKGQEWFSPDQISSLGMGDPRVAIYADHPLSGPGQAATTARVSTPSATTMAGNQPASPDQQPSVLGVPQSALLSALPFGVGYGLQSGQDLASRLLSSNLSPDTQNQAQTVAQAVLNVGGPPVQALGQTGQNLLQQGQDLLSNNPLTSAISQAPQSLNDMLQQNQLLASGIPITSASSVLPDLSAQGITGAVTNLGSQLPNYLQSLGQSIGAANQANIDYLTQHPEVAALGGLQPDKPIDWGSPNALPQLTGFDPYGQIVQQGIPSMVRGVQTGDVGDVLGGLLQTGMGAASALPGGGGPEVSAGRNLVLDAIGNPDIRALLSNRLATGPQAQALEAAAPGVSQIPWGTATRALLEQGPTEASATPAILRVIDDAAQARALGVSPDVLAGQFDDLGRRIPPGMLENPLTSADLGRASYDQYGVFQREPSLFSDRGIAMDPATGQEIVPSEAGPLDWRTQMPASATLEGLQQMALARGLDPTAPLLTQRLADLTDQVNAAAGAPFGGRQPGLASAQFARLLGGGAAGGVGAYEATDPNDPNRLLKIAGGAGLGALAVGPGLDIAAQIPGRFAAASGSAPGAISAADWARGLYRGGVISGLNTMADVASNATIGPIMSAGAGYLRDLASLSPGRAAGRTLGALSGMATWGDNFLDGLSQSLARPGSLTARAGPGVPQIVANLADGFGALHGAFQNATSMLQQSMELGAAAGDRAGNNIFDPAWHSAYATNLTTLPADVIARAQGAGARAAASSDLGQLTGALGRLVGNMGPVGDALFPVYRMGMNLASRMVEFSPLGLAGTALDVGKSLAGRGPYAAGLGTTPAGTAVGPLGERLANNVLGTALSVWLASKALGGAITGDGPSDPDQRAVWLANGIQPNSFLGPDGAYHSWEKLPPQLRGPMMTAGAYADAAQAYNQALKGQGTAGPQAYNVQDPREAAAAQLVSEVGKQLMSATPLRTFANLYDAVGSGASAASTGLTAASDIASSVLGGVIPVSGVVRSVAQMTDPLQRQALTPTTSQQVPQSIFENVAQNIPGAREQLLARLDVLGRPVANPLQGFGEISPFRPASGQTTPLLTAMQSAGVAPGATPSTIPYGPSNEIQLTPQERQAYEQYRGQVLQQATANLVTSDAYRAMPPFAQRAALQNVESAAAAAAGRMVLRDVGSAGLARAMPTGVLAPVVGYSPDVMSNQLLLEQQLQRNAQHQALIQSLLGQSS